MMGGMGAGGAMGAGGMGAGMYGQPQQQQGGNEIENMFNSGFLMNISSFMTMATSKRGGELGPYVQRFLDVIRNNELAGMPAGMYAQIYQILFHVSTKVPDQVYPHLDDIYKVGMSVEATDSSISMILDACAKAKAPGAVEKCLAMLGQLICEPELRSMSIVLVLSHILNQCDALGEGKEKLIDPFLPKIREYRPQGGMVVEKIEDWHDGRSLKKTDQRVDALEARIDALNGEFGAACANMDEVSKLMDKKIAEVKDFIGEVVKKLPQPCKLVVLGTVRKTLQLHFACAKTGNTITTETKDWNSWCKVGFGLVKLGKCAVTASAGNPMALAGGVGAIQDIYKAYKSKDDQDFNTFIREPFLTSAESDRLINQLRAGGFFSKMKYDNQLGDWVMINPAEGNVALALAEDEPVNPINSSGSSNAKKSGSWFGGSSKKSSGGAATSGGGGGGGMSAADMNRIAELESEVAQLRAEVERLMPLEEKFLKLEARVIKQLKMSEGTVRV
jgi:uncharacterized membrane protein YgcG